eukprot:COSAG06_NODE_33578_length_487_cov_1.760309_1_plen_29_part_10
MRVGEEDQLRAGSAGAPGNLLPVAAGVGR